MIRGKNRPFDSFYTLDADFSKQKVLSLQPKKEKCPFLRE
jgi:hypothetical protein